MTSELTRYFKSWSFE